MLFSVRSPVRLVKSVGISITKTLNESQTSSGNYRFSLDQADRFAWRLLMPSWEKWDRLHYSLKWKWHRLKRGKPPRTHRLENGSSFGMVHGKSYKPS